MKISKHKDTVKLCLYTSSLLWVWIFISYSDKHPTPREHTNKNSNQSIKCASSMPRLTPIKRLNRCSSPTANLEDSFQAALTKANGVFTSELEASLEAWVLVAPKEAGNQLLEMQVDLREPLLRCWARQWSQRDFHSAWEWVSQWSDSSLRDLLLGEMCQKFALNQPEAALSLAIEQPHNHGWRIQIENIVSNWAKSDAKAAQRWTSNVQDTDLRDRLVLRIAFEKSMQESPQLAMNYVLSELEPGLNQDEAVMMVLHQWAYSDQDSAAAWVERFPIDHPLKRRADAEILGSFHY